MSATRPYESPLRAEQLEQTRLRILEAMADVLADEEVEEVTVPLVAMRARVSVRTVYRHFPTKEALFDAFGEWGEEHLRLVLFLPGDARRDPRDGACSYIAGTKSVRR